MSWKTDHQWATERRQDVAEILKRHLCLLAEVRFATEEEDTEQSTDMVVESTTGTVSIRIRDTVRDFRDWTIRSHRVRRDGSPGNKTELPKLKEGFARWYLYGWCKPADGRIGDYVLIDLDRVRACGLMDADRDEQTADRGRTFFVSISVDELRTAGVLAVDACSSPCPRPRGNYQPAASVKNLPVQLAEPVKPEPVVRKPQQQSLFGPDLIW